MSTTIDAAHVIERLTEAGQPELAAQVALDALRSTPDTAAPTRGYFTRDELLQLGPGGLTDLVYRQPSVYVESMKRL